jgi:hypothetical protein
MRMPAIGTDLHVNAENYGQKPRLRHGKRIYAPAIRFTPMSYTNLIKVGG